MSDHFLTPRNVAVRAGLWLLVAGEAALFIGVIAVAGHFIAEFW